MFLQLNVDNQSNFSNKYLITHLLPGGGGYFIVHINSLKNILIKIISINLKMNMSLNFKALDGITFCYFHDTLI